MNLSYKSAKTSFSIAYLVLSLYFLPFILEWDNSIITAHDNLDSSFTYYMILASEGKTLSLNPNAKVESVMNGLPRMFFPSGFNVLAILCMIFPPYLAYLLNFIVVHTLAFVGMFLFLRRHILQTETDIPTIIFSSLAFSLIPFSTVLGLSVAGIPLLLYSFLNFYRRRATRLDYLICVLFPFYSFFVLSGLFLIVCTGIWFLTIKVRKEKKDLLIPILLLTGGYIIAEYQMFYQILFRSDIVSHRAEFVIEKINFEASVEAAKDLFLNIQYHASNPPHFIIPVFILGLIIGIAKSHRMSSLLISLFLLNVSISLIHVLYNWASFSKVIEDLPFINSFQWNRFYFLSPVIWYLKFALAVKIIFDSVYTIRWGATLIIFIFTYQFYFLWNDNKEYKETVNNLFAEGHYGTSFKDFYSHDLFTEIRDHIGRPQSEYRVASIALHPAVAQFSGFYTIDSYQNNYFLSYKKHFRSIISRELDKSANLKGYFDGWGSRCYLFANAIFPEYSITRWAGYSSAEVNLNFQKGPHVDYIFSAVEITNAAMNDMELVKVFDKEAFIYKVYVYKVNAEDRQKRMEEIASQVTGGIVGIAAELGLEESSLESLPYKYEILPRLELLLQATRFGSMVIDGQGNSISIINDPQKLKPEEFNIHLMTNYWEYNNELLTVAATTTLSSPPINFNKGLYELIITGESSSVNNITSHIIITCDGNELGQTFLPASTGIVTIPFRIPRQTSAPLQIRFTNDIKIGNDDRNFWLRNISIKIIE